MSQPDIKAEKINSPIQLMAAWFVMLILLSGVLLTTASQIEKPTWAAGYLIIATSILILIVIATVILMLTKYRPHLQEGKEYAEWLKDKNRYGKGIIRKETKDSSLELIKQKLEELKSTVQDSKERTLINKVEDSILYEVSISDLKGAETIISAISKFNVKTKIYKDSQYQNMSFNDHEAIWLGSNVPAEIAVPVIKTAVSIWPHLKYIGFPRHDAPEFTSWQIYLGGATSSAKDKGYSPWSNEEMNALEIKDLNSFHAEINKKLP